MAEGRLDWKEGRNPFVVHIASCQHAVFCSLPCCVVLFLPGQCAHRAVQRYTVILFVPV